MGEVRDDRDPHDAGLPALRSDSGPVKIGVVKTNPLIAVDIDDLEPAMSACASSPTALLRDGM